MFFLVNNTTRVIVVDAKISRDMQIADETNPNENVR